MLPFALESAPFLHFFSHYFWSRVNLHSFQLYCFLIAIFAVAGFEITGHFVDVPKRNDGKYLDSELRDPKPDIRDTKELTFFAFVKTNVQLQEFRLLCFGELTASF